MKTVAYQGAPGAFSHEACLRFMPDYEPREKGSFAAVLEAVTSRETDCGILPVENNSAGPVPEVQELLAHCQLETLATYTLPIRIHLLALPGSSLDMIRTIISHPMALAQCALTLRSLRLPVEAAVNTALAARILATTTDRSTAVLASETASETYGLTILLRDVQDRPDNSTVFRVLGPRSDSGSSGKTGGTIA